MMQVMISLVEVSIVWKLSFCLLTTSYQQCDVLEGIILLCHTPTQFSLSQLIMCTYLQNTNFLL